MRSLPYNYVTVIYHSRDMDGWTSGAILQKKYPGCTLIGFDYGEPFPNIPKGTEYIIIVDVCMKPADMRKLASIGKIGLTYIDHHDSSIAECKDDIEKNGAYKVGTIFTLPGEKIAACELTWKHCFPGTPTPVYVELIGSDDTGRKTSMYPNNKSRDSFLASLADTFVSPETCPPWVLERLDDMTSLGFKKRIAANKALIAYRKKNAFEDSLLEYKALCLEVKTVGHRSFIGVNRKKYDVLLAFKQLDGYWKCSIYTNPKVQNASEICQKFGGGGHAHAAGFQIEDITTILKNYKNKIK